MEQCKHTYKNNTHTVSFEKEISLVYDEALELISSTIPANTCSFEHYNCIATQAISRFNLDKMLTEDEYPASTQIIINVLSTKTWINLRGTESRGELVYMLRKNIKAGLIQESEVEKEKQ